MMREFTRRHGLRAGVLAALTALGVVACSGDDPDKYPNADSFCAAKAKEECQVAAKCAVTVDACEAERRSACTKQVAAAAGRPYRPKSAEACVNRAHELYAKSDPLTPKLLTDLDVAATTKESTCAKVFVGEVKRLGACTTDIECEGDMICDKKLCAVRVTKNAGELCGNPGEVCGGNAYCDTASGGAAQCKPKAGKGELCTKVACQEGLRCLSICTDPLGPGQVCNTDADCGPTAPLCDHGAGDKCTAGWLFAPGASACSEFGG